MRRISIYNKKAFTLIELVLVMFIICLLAYAVYRSSAENILRARSDSAEAEEYFSSLNDIEFTFETANNLS